MKAELPTTCQTAAVDINRLALTLMTLVVAEVKLPEAADLANRMSSQLVPIDRQLE